MPIESEKIQEDSFSSDAELDEEADESSTDVDGKLEEEDVFDVDFFKCYSALKKKDEKIYDQNVKFFQNHSSSSSDSDSGNSKVEQRRTKKDAPKMTLLDHHLTVKDDEIEDLSSERVKVDLNKEVSKSFYEKELEEIKRSIEKVGDEIDSESDEDLLTVKTSNKSESNSKVKADKIKTILDKIEDQEDEDLQHLKQVWCNPENLSQEDRFLRDYILNKRYLPRSHRDQDEDADDEGEEDKFFSNNIDELSDAEDAEAHDVSKPRTVPHHSDEKDFDKIARIPRNSTKTIRDLVEKKEKNEKRLKKAEKEKKRKKAIKNADCEDLVGDLPTRFHYRETEPNDYGLTAEELLLATDEELDKWVSLKDCIAYKSPEEEKAHRRKFESKRNDIELKRKIFKSIYGEPTDQTSDQADQSTVSAASITSKKKKRRSRKRKIGSDSESSFKESANNSLQDLSVTSDKGADVQPISNRQQKKKRRKRGLNHKKFAKIGVAPDRLLAYGLSKTRLKKSKIL